MTGYMLWDVIIRSFNCSPAGEIEPSAKQHFMSEVYLTMRMHHQENSARIDGLMRFLLKQGILLHASQEAMGVCDHEPSREEVRHQIVSLVIYLYLGWKIFKATK